MANATELELLTSGNSLYQNNYARWKFLYDSFIGGQQYKSGQYLTRYVLEDDKEYLSRIQSTPLNNQCASVISVYNSFLFREEPDRNFGVNANYPLLGDFLDDADYEGRDLDSFMKEVSTWAKVFGHSWMIMSKPNINAVSLAEEQAAGVRPYLSMLTPLVVLDWSWTRSINGRYTLDLLRYVEDINGEIQTIKTWTPDTITTNVIDMGKQLITSHVIEDNQLGIIPAVIVYNERSIVRGIGVSAINDIADSQRFIYNCTSEVNDSIRLDSHPSLVKTTSTIAGVGAGAIINLDDSMNPELKPYVLDFAGASVDNIYTAINNTIGDIEKMAAIGSVRGTEAKTMSGVAMEVDFQMLNAKLSEQADCLELAEKQMWTLFCAYQGLTYDMDIEYPDSFNIRDESREMDLLVKAASTNPTDPRTRIAIDMKVLDMLNLDEDELAAIADKALVDLDSIPETGEIPE